MVTTRSSSLNLSQGGPRRSVPHNRVSKRARQIHDRRAQNSRLAEVLAPVQPFRLPVAARPIDLSQSAFVRSSLGQYIVAEALHGHPLPVYSSRQEGLDWDTSEGLWHAYQVAV
ncbi:hypothetical protein G6011_02093 [Alternaria panax]|uniref:Uncharacterized protein n=1 Tax=Alternaria panax TaxID=48097 RepID=A0AAD4FDS5_9PLEO|nr:hypothetical protein G6011_02093 [Alternaria panax]